jgi:hypothetical protein
MPPIHSISVVVLLLAWANSLAAQAPREPAANDELDFNHLPDDERVLAWLIASSPTFGEIYRETAARSYVQAIKLRRVDCGKEEYSKIGVFFVDGSFEIRLSDNVAGAERVRALAFEIANAYLHDEHRQIDAGAARGLFTAREFALAHEIYEYEAWRLYRRVLFDLEQKLGAGNLPRDLFYGRPARRVADYSLPPLAEFLEHMERSGHMRHYLDWFEKYYAAKERKNDERRP